MSEMIQAGFDYGSLPAESAIVARTAAERIRLRLKRTVEDIIEIGRELAEVKAELPHGQFLPWIAAEFEMERQTASNFMSVYEKFGDGKFPIIGNFKPTILYALSAPSTPDSVIEKAIEQAEAGEKVTVAGAVPIRQCPSPPPHQRPAGNGRGAGVSKSRAGQARNFFKN